MKNIYTYKVKLANPNSQYEPHIIQYGITFASKYSDAADNIEKYFRSELMSIEHLSLVEATDASILPLPKEICDLYEKNNIPWEEWEDRCEEE